MKGITDDIISLPRAVKGMGYKCKLDNADGWEGLYKVDSSGREYTTTTVQGVRRVKLDQAAIIEGYWEKYKHLRRSMPPANPYTADHLHPTLDADGKVAGVSEEEAHNGHQESISENSQRRP
jgi:hypothetical protein